MTTPTALPCVSCGTTGGYIRVGLRITPDRVRGLCNRCKARELRTGAIWDRPLSARRGEPFNLVMPTGLITLASRGIRTGQPPTDPNLTPKVVWAIAHLNARRATHWLVNTGRMTPDEAAALVMLSYTPPADTAQQAAA